MKIALITEAELARSHGTGAQLLRLFEGLQYHHLYWGVRHGRRSEVRNSSLLADPETGVDLLSKIKRRARRYSGLSWWNGSSVNRGKLQALLSGIQADFDVAFVVVGRESDAARAWSLVTRLGCPYIVWVVDIMHEGGLDPESMPGFRALLANAAAVLSLMPSISSELIKFGVSPVEVFVGQHVHSVMASPPVNGQPIRIVTGGRPYSGGCRFLAQAWPAIQAQFPHVELVYVGPHFADLPEELRPVAANRGFLEEDAYRRCLAECHIAFLSGPDLLDMFGKFSFPSRTSDYLMAGLPVVGKVPAHSATQKVLMPLQPQAVRMVQTDAQLMDALNALLAPEAWSRASQMVRAYAERFFSLERNRGVIMGLLSTARGEVVCTT